MVLKQCWLCMKGNTWTSLDVFQYICGCVFISKPWNSSVMNTFTVVIQSIEKFVNNLSPLFHLAGGKFFNISTPLLYRGHHYMYQHGYTALIVIGVNWSFDKLATTANISYACQFFFVFFWNISALCSYISSSPPSAFIHIFSVGTVAIKSPLATTATRRASLHPAEKQGSTRWLQQLTSVVNQHFGPVAI